MEETVSQQEQPNAVDEAVSALESLASTLDRRSSQLLQFILLQAFFPLSYLTALLSNIALLPRTSILGLSIATCLATLLLLGRREEQKRRGNVLFQEISDFFEWRGDEKNPPPFPVKLILRRYESAQQLWLFGRRVRVLTCGLISVMCMLVTVALQWLSRIYYF